MTREELVLQRLNTLEQRIKRATEKDDDVAVELAIKEQNGYVDALVDLGYRPLEDAEKAEMIDRDEKGILWIYRYIGLHDVTGR